MHIQQRAAVQRCLDRIGDSGTVLAALFSTNAPDGTEDFRFEAPGDRREAREAIARLHFRFRTEGGATFVNEGIVASGESLRLLASTYQSMGYRPFLVVVAKVPDDGFELHRVRRLMEEVAAGCIRQCESPKWS